MALPSPTTPRLRKKRKKKVLKPLPWIGWREWMGFPALGIERIKAKVDTGARTSALHAFDVEPFTRDGADWVRFVVHPLQRDPETAIEVEAPLVEERWVRSSTGKATLRPVIRTTVALGEVCWPIEITLVRRDLMGFRMLLGRQAVKNRFLVHPGRSYLAGVFPPGTKLKEKV